MHNNVNLIGMLCDALWWHGRLISTITPGVLQRSSELWGPILSSLRRARRWWDRCCFVRFFLLFLPCCNEFFLCCNRWFSNVALRFLGRCNRCFCDVAVLLLEMLQYIVFRCCSTYFSMLQYILFRCCSTYFLMLQYMFLDVTVHIFSLL
jgi:hypothetical protein